MLSAMLVSTKGGDDFNVTLEVIRKYYPDSSDDESKEIQEVVYLLACAVMQHFYGSEWMGGFEEVEQEGRK